MNLPGIGITKTKVAIINLIIGYSKLLQQFIIGMYPIDDTERLEGTHVEGIA